MRIYQGIYAMWIYFNKRKMGLDVQWCDLKKEFQEIYKHDVK